MTCLYTFKHRDCVSWKCPPYAVNISSGECVMIDFINFESINFSQFFDSVKVRSGTESRYHLVTVYYKVMFYMLTMLMKFSFVPQNFFRFFFQDQDQDQDQDFTIKINNKSYALCSKDTHQFLCRFAKFLSKSKSCSKSGSWFYFEFQYQIYISYMEDTEQIFFGSANSFECYCVHSKSPRTAIHPDRHEDRQTDGNFFSCFVFWDIQNMNIYQKEIFFYFLISYGVCKKREYCFSLMRLQYFLFLHTPYVMWK